VITYSKGQRLREPQGLAGKARTWREEGTNKDEATRRKRRLSSFSCLFLSFFLLLTQASFFFFLEFLMLLKWPSSEKILRTLSYFRQLWRFWLFSF
jgi:hypothetical protein